MEGLCLLCPDRPILPGLIEWEIKYLPLIFQGNDLFYTRIAEVKP